jgi:hypothetical protein
LTSALKKNVTMPKKCAKMAKAIHSSTSESLSSQLMVDMVFIPRVQLSVPRFIMHPAARINSTATKKSQVS